MRKNKILYTVSIFLAAIILSGCSNSGKVNEDILENKASSQVVNSKRTMSEIISDMKKSEYECPTMSIKYVSKDKIILCNEEGLIVYDFNRKEILRAIDLREIEMNHLCGDVITIFQSDDSGNNVFMYNINDNTKQHVYDVENDKIHAIDELENYNIDMFNDEHSGKNEFSDIEYNKNIEKYSYAECDSKYAIIDNDTIAYIIRPNDCREDNSVCCRVIIFNESSKEEISYDIL